MKQYSLAVKLCIDILRISGQSYSADLTEIPSTAFDEEIFAVPFIMFGEEAVIITDMDLYENNTVNNKDINKEVEK